jgi:hypothetical protein
MRAQSEKKIVPSYPIETAENVRQRVGCSILPFFTDRGTLQPHPAIPMLTPWEARMVKTFLIGAPKKDSAHPEATAGRKVSSISQRSCLFATY